MQVSTGSMYEYFLPSISFFFYKDNTFVQDIIIIIIYIGRLLVQNYWIIVKEERKERRRGEIFIIERLIIWIEDTAYLSAKSTTT